MAPHHRLGDAMTDLAAVEPDIPELPVTHGFKVMEPGRRPVSVAKPLQTEGQLAKQVADCSGRPHLGAGSPMRRKAHRLLHFLLFPAPSPWHPKAAPKHRPRPAPRCCNYPGFCGICHTLLRRRARTATPGQNEPGAWQTPCEPALKLAGTGVLFASALKMHGNQLCCGPARTVVTMPRNEKSGGDSAGAAPSFPG